MRATLAVLVSVALAAPVLAQPSMHEAEGRWLLWSQHKSPDGNPPEQYGLWWRTEAGPFTADECRAELKKASGRPKVRFTAWYDISPEQLSRAFGQVATPDRGTWIACWPVGLDFDRDLADR